MKELDPKLRSILRQGLRDGKPKSSYWRYRINAEVMKWRVCTLTKERNDLRARIREGATQEADSNLKSRVYRLEAQLRQTLELHERQRNEAVQAERRRMVAGNRSLLEKIQLLQRELNDAQRQIRELSRSQP